MVKENEELIYIERNLHDVILEEFNTIEIGRSDLDHIIVDFETFFVINTEVFNQKINKILTLYDHIDFEEDELIVRSSSLISSVTSSVVEAYKDLLPDVSNQDIVESINIITSGSFYKLLVFSNLDFSYDLFRSITVLKDLYKESWVFMKVFIDVANSINGICKMNCLELCIENLSNLNRTDLNQILETLYILEKKDSIALFMEYIESHSPNYREVTLIKKFFNYFEVEEGISYDLGYELLNQLDKSKWSDLVELMNCLNVSKNQDFHALITYCEFDKEFSYKDSFYHFFKKRGEFYVYPVIEYIRITKKDPNKMFLAFSNMNLFESFFSLCRVSCKVIFHHLLKV